jgi:hypothetical protein
MAVAARDGSRRWEPFGVTEADFAAVPERDGVKVVNVTPGGGRGPRRAGWWLCGAAVVLALLAAAAAAVSWQAQYVMVWHVKHAAIVAAIEAAIPDAGAVIFAALGVALALHGKRALRPRVLNAACIGISLSMNALAAGHGWRDLAIWVMPAVVYAVASDTLIGVIRAWVLARQRAESTGLADDGPDLLAALGGVALWLLRLALAGRSTLRGFRAWVIEECPVAPGRKAAPALPAPPAAETVQARRPGRRATGAAGTTKRDLLIQRAAERRDLASIPQGEVSKLASALAADMGYSPGTARRELARYVRQLQSAPGESTAAAGAAPEGGVTDA